MPGREVASRVWGRGLQTRGKKWVGEDLKNSCVGDIGNIRQSGLYYKDVDWPPQFINQHD